MVRSLQAREASGCHFSSGGRGTPKQRTTCGFKTGGRFNTGEHTFHKKHRSWVREDAQSPGVQASVQVLQSRQENWVVGWVSSCHGAMRGNICVALNTNQLRFLNPSYTFRVNGETLMKPRSDNPVMQIALFAKHVPSGFSQ